MKAGIHRAGEMLAIALLCGITAACSPRIIEKVRTEYIYRDVYQRDTTVLHDSTYIREYVKGDTVRITEYRDRYLYRDRLVERTDTVAVHDTTTVTREVEKRMNGWQRFRLDGFWVLLAALAIVIAVLFIRKK